jgi:hypothetical protein
VAQLYLWAFVVRALAGLLAYVLTFYAEVPLLIDALTYEEAGYSVAQMWLMGRSVDFDSLSPGAQTGQPLVILVASFYYLAGGARVLPVLLVVYSLVTALVPGYVYRVARELRAPEVVARRAGWLVALSPAFVFWSGSLYKEGLTLLCISLVAYHALRLQSGWRARSAVSITICILALWGLRYYLAIVVMAAVLASLVWGRKGEKLGRPARVPVAVRQAAIMLGFVALLFAFGVTERAQHVLLENNQGVLEVFDIRRGGSAREANTGYLQDLSVATPEEALQYFPLGLLYFLTVPFPWQLGSVPQNLIVAENAFWLGLYPLIVVGSKRALSLNRSGTVFVLLLTGGMCAVYALLVGNMGTAYRMRSQVWLLWAPFATWGWEIWRERRRQARPVRLAHRGSMLVRERPR